MEFLPKKMTMATQNPTWMQIFPKVDKSLLISRDLRAQKYDFKVSTTCCKKETDEILIIYKKDSAKRETSVCMFLFSNLLYMSSVKVYSIIYFIIILSNYGNFVIKSPFEG